jgi:hypothetical protein
VRPPWQYAAEMLLKAADDESDDLTAFWAQLRRALMSEGML